MVYNHLLLISLTQLKIQSSQKKVQLTKLRSHLPKYRERNLEGRLHLPENGNGVETVGSPFPPNKILLE